MIGVSEFARSYLRTRATFLMDDSKDSCVISRPGPQRVSYDPVTGKTTRLGAEQVYSGICRLHALPGGGETWVQDKELIITRARLSLPFDVTMPEPDDIVTITSSDDTQIVGRSLTIDSVYRAGGLRGSRVLNVTFIDTAETGDL